MLRGMTTFVCDNCGHKFKAMDIEWKATAYSQPMRCPQCGNYHTRPTKMTLILGKLIYRKIWKEMDSEHIESYDEELDILSYTDLKDEDTSGKEWISHRTWLLSTLASRTRNLWEGKISNDKKPENVSSNEWHDLLGEMLYTFEQLKGGLIFQTNKERIVSGLKTYEKYGDCLLAK